MHYQPLPSPDKTFESATLSQRWMLPVYSALHLIPMLVLRHKHVMRDPLGMLTKAAVGVFRSSSFLGLFVTIYQGESFRSLEKTLSDKARPLSGLLCFRIQTIEGYFGKPPQWLHALFKRKQVFWLMGFATCLSVFAEESVSCPLSRPAERLTNFRIASVAERNSVSAIDHPGCVC